MASDELPKYNPALIRMLDGADFAPDLAFSLYRSTAAKEAEALIDSGIATAEATWEAAKSRDGYASHIGNLIMSRNQKELDARLDAIADNLSQRVLITRLYDGSVVPPSEVILPTTGG